MKIEFPLKHIENNLIFNRNGDVWAYFKTDTFNLYLLKYKDLDTHIYVSNNQDNKNMFYVGYKLKEVLGNKSSVKTNVKSFFEGLNSQVSRSVGIEPYSIIHDDIKDYTEQAEEINAFLTKRMEVKSVETKEAIMIYKHLLNLSSNNEGEGILNLNGVNIEPYNQNTLHVTSSLDNDGIFVQHIVVRSIDKVEYITSLLELDVPIQMSVRVNKNDEISIILRIESTDYNLLEDNIDKIYDYALLLNMDLITPLGEQFILLYESILGTNKTYYDYLVTERKSEVIVQ